MSFANPADVAATSADAYTRSLLAVLADRDPLAVQAEQSDRLAAAVAGLDDAALRQPEAAGKWSVAEVVAHLADSELVTRYRMRRTAAQPGLPIEAYDQDAWARELRYRDEDVAACLATHRLLRAENLRWLRRLPAEALERAGIHAERGRESVSHVIRLVAGHDLVHLAQISRIRAAIGA